MTQIKSKKQKNKKLLHHVTVEEAMMIGGLKNGRLIGGKSGLSNIVKTVSVIEVPEAIDWFKGNELFLTAFYTIKDDIEKQVAMMEAMAKFGSACLVICYPSLYTSDFPEELIAKADELSLPLILLPKEVAYIDVIYPILEEIINRESKRLQYTINVNEKLTEIVFKSNNIEVLTKELSDILNCTIVVTDFHYEIISQYAVDDHRHLLRSRQVDFDEILNESVKEQLSEYKSVTIKKDYGDVILSPIAYGKQFYGVLLIISNEKMNKLEEIAISQAITALAIVMMNKTSIEQAEAKKKEDFLTDLLTNRYKTNEGLMASAQRFKWDLNKKKLILYCSIRFSKDYQTHQRDGIYHRIRYLVDKDSTKNIMIESEQGVSVFLHGEDSYEKLNERARGMGEDILNLLRNIDPDVKFCAGTGSYAEKPINLNSSYFKAVKITEILEKMGVLDCTVGIENIQMFVFLDQIINEKDAQKYILQQVRLLKDYDKEKGTDLFMTFELLLFDVEINVIATKMHIHRNTIPYRKDRIKKILGIDPFVEPFKTNYKLIVSLYRMNFL